MSKAEEYTSKINFLNVALPNYQLKAEKIKKRIEKLEEKLEETLFFIDCMTNDLIIYKDKEVKDDNS